MLPAPRILIVDESAESREVLSTLLQRQGATTLEADRPELAIQITSLQRPDLIVFDADSDHSDGGEPTCDLGAAATRNDTPIVVLGTVRKHRELLSTGEFVAKPYHYPPLIRKIEELLAAC